MRVARSFIQIRKSPVGVLPHLPVETRKANSDGTTSYIRPLPGGARMYPETDLKPIILEPRKLSALKKKIPTPPWDEIKRIEKKYGISNELATELYNEGKVNIFRKLCIETGIDEKIIANTLTNVWNSLNPEVELSARHFLDLFKALKSGKFSKEAIPQVLEMWLRNLSKTLDEVLSELGLQKISASELEKIIDAIVEKNSGMISERGEKALQPLMGEVMKEVRGRADGKLIMGILRKKLRLDK